MGASPKTPGDPTNARKPGSSDSRFAQVGAHARELGETAKAAALLVTVPAHRAHLMNVALPAAHRELVRHIHEGGRFRDEFPDLFAQIAAVQEERARLAWWCSKYAPSDRDLALLEAQAKAAKRGLWSQPGAVPPWDWRSGKGVPVTLGVVGNRRSHLYQAPNCRGAAATSEKNRVPFKTAAEAEAAGYRKVGDCK